MTLGNLAYYETLGSGPQPGWGQANVGPFSNVQAYGHWSGTSYPPSPSDAWYFGFYLGRQMGISKSNDAYAWAVSPGDTVVPVPAAVGLPSSGLGVLGVLKRRQASALLVCRLHPLNGYSTGRSPRNLRDADEQSALTARNPRARRFLRVSVGSDALGMWYPGRDSNAGPSA